MQLKWIGVHAGKRRYWLGLLTLVVLGAVWLCSWRTVLARPRSVRTFDPASTLRVEPATAGSTPESPTIVPALSSAAVLPMQGDFAPISALFLGCNELTRYYPDVFVNIVRAAHPAVTLIGLVSNQDELARAEALLAEAGVAREGMRFLVVPLDSMWVRDYGPLFVRRSDGSTTVMDLEYAKVDDAKERKHDDGVPRMLADILNLPLKRVPLMAEGGNILSNGDGLCVTSSALISKNVDRGYGLEQMGRMLAENFGFKTWVFVRQLKGEPTGHADMFMTFLDVNAVLVGQYDSQADPDNAALLDEAAARLAEVQTSRGRMQVHRIPMPPRHDDVWRSYNNVVFANGVLLVPTYEDVEPALQQQALDTYARLLPNHRIIGIPAEILAPQRGLLHCITINVPKFVSIEAIVDATTDRSKSSM